ncbi:MAG: hypothetical protein D6739_06960, partial [Nitrospirae bacterium]
MTRHALLLATILCALALPGRAAAGEPEARRQIVETPPDRVVSVEAPASPDASPRATARKANRVLGLLANPGELTAAHAASDGLSHCVDCHVLGGGVKDG